MMKDDDDNDTDNYRYYDDHCRSRGRPITAYKKHKAHYTIGIALRHRNHVADDQLLAVRPVRRPAGQSLIIRHAISTSEKRCRQWAKTRNLNSPHYSQTRH